MWRILIKTHMTKLLWECSHATFFQMAHEWEPTELEQANLLGTTLEQINVWRTQPWMKPSGEAMARLDDLLAIHHILDIRFKAADERNEWLRQPGALPEMGGQSPLAAMSSADSNNLGNIRSRLAARLPGW